MKFSEFKDLWFKTGGLIPQGTAAKILSCNRSQIPFLWKKHLFVYYDVYGIRYVKLSDVYTILEARKKNG